MPAPEYAFTPQPCAATLYLHQRRRSKTRIFPHRDSVLRLTGALLAEQDDEWATSRRYFSVESMRAVSGEQTPTSALTAPLPTRPDGEVKIIA